MYQYEWDASTGGYVLLPLPMAFSKEPRPVYYKELDILGFDRYWQYDKNDAYPYMWAEANNYYYRGRLVAKTKGGSIYTAPEIEIFEAPEPDGMPLRFVDIPAMVEKNRELLGQLAQDTIKKVYNTFIQYREKVDVFYVAFSGGKDSVVTFDLVQRALPHNQFKVLFGDTGMEFPDTYETVEKIKAQCSFAKIDFIVAKSHFSPDESWRLFGPPATVNRWCCSVHKTSPQIITLRKILGKSNFTGMAFIGVRSAESVARSEYDYISLGEKHKGQYSCNPILDWNSAELYSYIFQEELVLNEAYKKGNRRAGCLVCPRAAERNEYMAMVCYPEEFNNLSSIIKELYTKSFHSEKKLTDFLANGGWKARKNGRDIDIRVNYKEYTDKKYGYISVSDPKTDWREWIKTIGILQNDITPYRVLYKGENYEFDLTEDESGFDVKYSIALLTQAPTFISLLKGVFRKAACCVCCQECEADCHNGCISMVGGKVTISDKCIHCSQCHKTEKGCLVYKSIQQPKGGSSMKQTESLNSFSHHAPKRDWIDQYFEYKNEFKEKHTLGSQMYNFFKRFLKDAGLSDENGFSRTAEIINDIGLDDDIAWALMLANLAYNRTIAFYVTHVNFNETFSKELVCSLLVDDGADEKWVGDVWNAYSRFLNLPFSHVGMGEPIYEKNKFIGIYRTPWENPDIRIILFSLYKFSEKCGNYRQFTLTRLLDTSIESDGISPTQIFGLDRETMERLLNSLTFNYPDLIEARFTLGLDSITLKSEKSADEVLQELF